eukprot:3891210-Pleurochrysis_carterae.AAC.1
MVMLRKLYKGQHGYSHAYLRPPYGRTTLYELFQLVTPRRQYGCFATPLMVSARSIAAAPVVHRPFLP